MSRETDGHNLINKWFASEAWSQICIDADAGDDDSIELMDEISEDLNNLVFHLQNKSGDNRISYELEKFQSLIDDFNVL